MPEKENDHLMSPIINDIDIVNNPMSIDDIGEGIGVGHFRQDNGSLFRQDNGSLMILLGELGGEDKQNKEDSEK